MGQATTSNGTGTSEDREAGAEEQCLRIVLVGKTGAGKSATGNTILGEERFKTAMFSSSVTSECQKETAEVEGQILAVVDTPGLFDTFREEKEIEKEIKRCVMLSSPGPHVFLVVIEPKRFTKEEQETVKIIQRVFGEKAARYTMVLFTYGDVLEKKKVSIEEFFSGNPNLHDLISQCGGGYHVFNNEISDPFQVRKLLEKINKMVQINGGRYFTNEMLEEAQRIKRETVMILIKENPGMEMAEAIKQAEINRAWGIFSKTMMICGGVIGSIGGPLGVVAGGAIGKVVADGARKITEDCLIQ